VKTARITIFILGSLLSVSAFTQKVRVDMTLDKKAIMIGEQFHMKVKVDQPANVTVTWPLWLDTLTKGVEIVEAGKTDTVFSADKENITFNKDYILTSFDSGAYQIPAFTFTSTNGNVSENIVTNPLFILVDKPAVDTSKGIKDIKGPLEIPFDWKEFIPHVLIGFGVVILIVLAVYFINRELKRRRLARENMPAYVPPPIPADEKALTALAELQEKQLWQRSKYKEYYTELTDILRVYIKDVYQIDAPEMLTDEILQHLKFKDIDGNHKQALKAVLELADMVKFAKVMPTETENTESIGVASRFVQDTASAIAAAKARQAELAKAKRISDEKKKNDKEGGKNEL
jgi:hypothetical protein